MNEVPLDIVELPDGKLLCTGTAKMAILSTDNKVRALTLYLQQAMEPDPVALFSLVDSAGDGNIFGVYSLKFGYVNGTQVGIEALSVGKTTADDIFCSYVIIGRPVKQQ